VQCLLLVLIGSNLQAFDNAGKDKDKGKEKEQPDNWSSAGSAMLPASGKSKRSLWLCPIPSWRKSICAF
jgi:hypothetical protein